MNNEQISEKLNHILQLRHEPVAIKLVKKGEEIPQGYGEPEKKIRHCQSIMKARKGESFVIPADKHGCAVGASSLGLVETPENVITGEFHHKIGMFQDTEAAANMIAQRYEMQCGDHIATVVCPLKEATFKPDVVVLVDLPETLYWLVPASTYEKGGRASISTAAFQATCVDSTVIPMQTGSFNLSLGCFGCRRTTDIGNEEMLAGIPGEQLENTVKSLEAIYDGPIRKARGIK